MAVLCEVVQVTERSLVVWMLECGGGNRAMLIGRIRERRGHGMSVWSV